MNASGLTYTELEEEEAFDLDRVVTLQYAAVQIAVIALICRDPLAESQKDAVRRAARTALLTGRPEDAVNAITKQARALAVAGASAADIDAAMERRCFPVWHRRSDVARTYDWQDEEYDSPYFNNSARIRALLSRVDLEALLREYCRSAAASCCCSRGSCGRASGL